MKSLISASAAANLAIPVLALLVIAVVATALFSSDKQRRETAITVLRILSAWILMLWLHG